MVHPVPAVSHRPRISAVTGTNGKTSVASATLQLMRGVGWRAAGYDSTGITETSGRLRRADPRRSPDWLPGVIDEQTAAGAEAFSLEAFVGILADGLLERVPVDVAICTGLQRDHLDVHKTLDGYWGAKLRLFGEHLRPDGIAVMAHDCMGAEKVRAEVERRGARLLVLGPGGDVELLDAAVVETTNGEFLEGTLRVATQAHPVRLPVTYTAAVTNLLLAATGVIALGAPPASVIEALAQVVPPPGRLQVIARRGGITAMVDTAHNPQALRTALSAVRERCTGRVVLVFGAGGERDRAKRPEMGQVAAELADLVVLTDDNPRREPPQRIRDEVRAGLDDCVEVPRREEAIRAALLMARPGDTVLVAGRGDETDQLRRHGRVPMDDREVIRTAMREI